MGVKSIPRLPSVGKSVKGIHSALLNSVKPQKTIIPIPVVEDVPVLKIPLTLQNILTLVLIVLLTIIGTVYIWILSTKTRCACRLCRKDFELHENIGEGGFGAIFLVTRAKQLSEKYILKKLEMRDLNELEKVQYEAKQLRMLQHKSIVKYEDEFLHMEHGPLKANYVYIIIMEYCSSGDLTDYIREHGNNGLAQQKVMKYFLEVCDAVRYLHQRDIIHRDIKSPNIFITDSDEAKLGDFGLCVHGKTIASKVRHSSAGAIGTNCYMAPELHKGQLFQKGKSADMWAIGCILLEMLTGTALWDLTEDLGTKCLEDPNFTMNFISQNETLVKKYDPKLISIAKRLLHPDPIQRLTVEELFRKKFVRQQLNKLSQVKKVQLEKYSGKRKLSTQISSSEDPNAMHF
ncbi:hypothetical protein FGO68_gene9858 [Halteria grandinella]|uniref:non-specific serine/threonine protein kinase n=1 Tax=Halteria grandinella TaxID=5974 RepID=A0A8J8NQD0_HALGN|nr:hypothetical protein FGO68_gene9858 [Halteria grandinella]